MIPDPKPVPMGKGKFSAGLCLTLLLGVGRLVGCLVPPQAHLRILQNALFWFFFMVNGVYPSLRAMKMLRVNR